MKVYPCSFSIVHIGVRYSPPLVYTYAQYLPTICRNKVGTSWLIFHTFFWNVQIIQYLCVNYIVRFLLCVIWICQVLFILLWYLVEKKGPIYAVEWSPNSEEFCVCYGCILTILTFFTNCMQYSIEKPIYCVCACVRACMCVWLYSCSFIVFVYY